MFGSILFTLIGGAMVVAGSIGADRVESYHSEVCHNSLVVMAIVGWIVVSVGLITSFFMMLGGILS